MDLRSRRGELRAVRDSGILGSWDSEVWQNPERRQSESESASRLSCRRHGGRRRATILEPDRGLMAGKCDIHLQFSMGSADGDRSTNKSRKTRFFRGTAMINKYVAIGLGALIALAPVAAVAQTPAATPGTSMASPTKHTGTHRSHMRRTGQHVQGPGEGVGSPHAQDADGAGGSQELIGPTRAFGGRKHRWGAGLRGPLQTLSSFVELPAGDRLGELVASAARAIRALTQSFVLCIGAVRSRRAGHAALRRSLKASGAFGFIAIFPRARGTGAGRCTARFVFTTIVLRSVRGMS